MKITESRIRRIIREELLREASGAAGPGTVPGYDYIEISEYKGKPAHMINSRHFGRALEELSPGITAGGRFVDQGDIGSVIRGWSDLSGKLAKIRRAGSPRDSKGRYTSTLATRWRGHVFGHGLTHNLATGSVIVTIVDLGLCNGVQAYLVPGLSVDSDIPLIVFGDIHSVFPTVVEDIRQGLLDKFGDEELVDPDAPERWIKAQEAVASSFAGEAYSLVGAHLLPEFPLVSMQTSSEVLVVLPRTSLVKDIDPCVVSKNYARLREPPPPPAQEETEPDSPSVEEIEADSPSATVEPSGQELDVDSEVDIAPLRPYKSPFRRPYTKYR